MEHDAYNVLVLFCALHYISDGRHSPVDGASEVDPIKWVEKLNVLECGVISNVFYVWTVQFSALLYRRHPSKEQH